MALKALGTIGITLSLASMNKLVEEYGKINDKINYATKSIKEGAEAQGQLLDAAQQARTTYAEMANEVTSMFNKGAGSIGWDDAVEYTKLLNYVGKSAGMAKSETSAMISSFTSLATATKISTQQISNLERQSPALFNVLAEGLGKTKKEIEALAKSGGLSATMMRNALVSQQDSIIQGYSKTYATISEGLAYVRDRWGLFLAHADETLGITEKIAGWLYKLADKAIPFLEKLLARIKDIFQKLGGVENVLKLIFVYFASSKLVAFIGILKSMAAAMTVAGVATNLAVLGFMALYLIIEDIVYFMQGKNSLLGNIIEKSGGDANKIREKIQNIVDKVTGFFKNVREFFESDVGKAILKIVAIIALVLVLSLIITSIVTAITTVGGLLTGLLGPIAAVTTAFLGVAAAVAMVAMYWDQVKETIGQGVKYSGETGAQDKIEDFNASSGLMWNITDMMKNSRWSGLSKFGGAVQDFLFPQGFKTYDSQEYISEDNRKAYDDLIKSWDNRTNEIQQQANAWALNSQYGNAMKNASSASAVEKIAQDIQNNSNNKYNFNMNMTQNNSFNEASRATGMEAADLASAEMASEFERIFAQYAQG